MFFKKKFFVIIFIYFIMFIKGFVLSIVWNIVVLVVIFGGGEIFWFVIIFVVFVFFVELVFISVMMVWVVGFIF